jgi:glyoxylase I family protein
MASMEKVMLQLRSAGLAVEVDPQPYPNGVFARLQDPEGNPIELWQRASTQ